MSKSMNGWSGDWVEDLVIKWLCNWLSPSEIECKRELERERGKEGSYVETLPKLVQAQKVCRNILSLSIDNIN